MSGEAEYWSFPTNKEEFDNDDRISFSKLDNKYIAVQEDGTEYEFDEGLKRWIPIIDDALIQEHQKAYMAPGADEDESVQSQGKKRKKDSNDREVSCVRMRIIRSARHYYHHTPFPTVHMNQCTYLYTHMYKKPKMHARVPDQEAMMRTVPGPLSHIEKKIRGETDQSFFSFSSFSRQTGWQ